MRHLGQRMLTKTEYTCILFKRIRAKYSKHQVQSPTLRHYLGTISILIAHKVSAKRLEKCDLITFYRIHRENPFHHHTRICTHTKNLYKISRFGILNLKFNC